MSWLKRIKQVCEDCSAEAKHHTLEYNTDTKDNVNHWYCGIHMPEWNVMYVPEVAFKKIFQEGGTNYVRPCNENGDR